MLKGDGVPVTKHSTFSEDCERVAIDVLQASNAYRRASRRKGAGRAEEAARVRENLVAILRRLEKLVALVDVEGRP